MIGVGEDESARRLFEDTFAKAIAAEGAAAQASWGHLPKSEQLSEEEFQREVSRIRAEVGQARLEALIVSLFDELTQSAQQRDAEAVLAALTRLRELLETHGEDSSALVSERLKRWQARMDELLRVQRSLDEQLKQAERER